ncbi:MAG: Gfo/Idh/MocA family oxidoreductase [Nitrospirae bacterium]|nr:Gfo/Idh/MocA family oxidoreductase [Nitrospirota bacterium]
MGNRAGPAEVHLNPFRLRYLLVGLGHLGGKRRRILGRACVATVDPENREADHRGIEQAPDAGYDAVILCVPNGEKLKLLRECLARRKHVLVEKPLVFPDLEIARSTAALASQSGCVWYTSYNHRFEPHIRLLKRKLDESTLGEIYHARIQYGNGTVRNWLGTWRESGYGVIEDLGSHLIDLAGYLFGIQDTRFRLVDARRLESKAYDYCLFATPDRRFFFECANIMWKNTFRVDVYGEKGSLHAAGLTKWGAATFELHRRVLPSGRPVETTDRIEMEDPTWELDIKEFERRVQEGHTSLDGDWRISSSLHRLAEQAARFAECRETE